MAVCSISTLLQQACDNGFMAAASDAVTFQALKLQLECNISEGGGGGGGTPSAPLNSVQFNDGGAFGGDADFTWDSTTNALSVAGSVITPLVVGGSSTTQDLSFKTTSGVGAAGADMHFLVGNNGATEAMTILNNGNVGIATTNPTTARLVVTGGAAAKDALDVVNSSFIQAVFRSTGSAGGLALVNLSGYQYEFQSDSSNNFTIFDRNAAQLRFRILSNGNINIGNLAPTAKLHIAAGSATASTAPLKFTSGPLLTAAEAGAVEFLTDKFYGTITTGAARHTFATLESAAQAFTNMVSAPTLQTSTAFTVGTLPAAGTAGRRAYVTDATAPTYLGALVGGGAVVCPVFDNGTAWVSA